MAAANDPRARSGTNHRLAEDLIAAARHEPAQRSRSRLAPCAPVISILREKGWSFAAITAWLGQRGMRAAESTVQRFHRSQQRRKAAGGVVPPMLAETRSGPQATQPHEIHDHQALRRPARTADRPKYNTDF